MRARVRGRFKYVKVCIYCMLVVALLYVTIMYLPVFQSSSNGVTLGTPNKATITILSNDNAFGIIAFNSVRESCNLYSFCISCHIKLVK